MKTLIHTIKIEDIDDIMIRLSDMEYIPVHDFMGQVQPRDVGKRIYKVDGVYQVENDEQVQHRMNGAVLNCAKCLEKERSTLGYAKGYPAGFADGFDKGWEEQKTGGT